MADEVQVQVRFTVEAEGYPAYTDALYVPLEDYQGLVDSGELERMKAERWEAWRAQLDAPAVEAEPLDLERGGATGVDAARQILSDALAQLDAVEG